VPLAIEMGLANMRRQIASWNLRVSAMVIRKHIIKSKTKGGAIASANEEGVGPRSKSPEEQRLTAI